MSCVCRNTFRKSSYVLKHCVKFFFISSSFVVEISQLVRDETRCLDYDRNVFCIRYFSPIEAFYNFCRKFECSLSVMHLVKFD